MKTKVHKFIAFNLKSQLNLKTTTNNNSGYFVFGSIVVFWNYSNAQMTKILNKDVTTITYKEDFIVRISDNTSKVKLNELILDYVNPERAKVIAQLLVHSISLDNYHERVEKLQSQLYNASKRYLITSKILHNLNSEISNIKYDLIKIGLLDKPDTIWEDNTLDKLYADLRNVFDLDVRYYSLQEKFRIIEADVTHLTERSSKKYTLISIMLEIIIIALIAGEIVINLK